MFIDFAKIRVKAGDGGNGCLAFRREKYVPRGGPSGGDGGRGGDVVLRSTPHLTTLLPFRHRKFFQAERGGHGSGGNRHGKDGADLIIKVPPGTQVLSSKSRQLLFDFTKPDQLFTIARGGRGGRGNARFATSTNQAPRRFENGFPGEEKLFTLELKLLADVGIIGYPNAGKSTLISVISAARPEIGDYPFTTLTPNLGVVSCGEYRSFVVADIPGLIEGAHSGAGLGDQFLRHVERTRLLVHLVDVSTLGPDDPVKAMEAIHTELRLHNPELERKKLLVVASKIDAAVTSKLRRLRNYCGKKEIELVSISSVQRKGIRALIEIMAQKLEIKQG
jgi:GTP-binding protein